MHLDSLWELCCWHEGIEELENMQRKEKSQSMKFGLSFFQNIRLDHGSARGQLQMRTPLRHYVNLN